MSKKRKQEIDFERECERIVKSNLSNVEVWLERLGKENPEAAIKMWVNISEFAHAKKARDAKMPTSQTINILMQPAQKRKLEPPVDNYIDITEGSK